MKVVLSTYTYPPEVGGVATTVSILAEAFGAAGHDVTVVTLAAGGELGGAAKVVRRPGPDALLRLYRGADILILANLSAKLYYPLTLLRRPFALHHHSESAFEPADRPWREALRKDALRRARHIVTSHFIGRRSGLAEFTVVHPFADPKHFTAPPLDYAADDADCALFVGRLEPEKGLQFLIERWPAIRAALGVSTLRIVGEGSLRGYAEARAAEDPHIDFLGPKPLSETAGEMARSPYLLAPSLWQEPFGAVALEGLAMGALVVLSDRGGLPETCGELGFYFDPDDAGSLERALAGARAARARHARSKAERRQYLDAAAQRLTAFAPARAVDTIIRALAQ